MNFWTLGTLPEALPEHVVWKPQPCLREFLAAFISKKLLRTIPETVGKTFNQYV